MARSATQTTGTNSRRRMTIPLRALLAISFGTLVALAVGAVLALTIRASFVNTFSLLNQRAVDLIDGLEQQVSAEADEASEAVFAVQKMYAEGRIGTGGSVERSAVLETLLRTVPPFEGLFMFVDDGGSPRLTDATFRLPDGKIGPPPPAMAQANLAELFNVTDTESTSRQVWGGPIRLDGHVFNYVSLPLKAEGRPDGVIVAAIGRHTINRLTSDLARGHDFTVFLLSSNGKVISHSGRPDAFRDGQSFDPKDFPDEVLQKLPYADIDEEFGIAQEKGIKVYVSPDGRDGHVYLIKPPEAHSPGQFTLGVYFTKAELGSEIFRTFYSMVAGLAGLLLAVVAAILLGKRIAKPMSDVARTATQFSDFQLDDIKQLPRSRIREIDNQAVALNKMHLAMEQFTRYVPRRLVARLMDAGDEANRPVEREVTIMFTDICSFTSLSERLSAAQTANVLNDHFEMMTRHIEASGGTVDKFMGDGVMAFWGAPDADQDHAAHAVHAAEAITQSVLEANRASGPDGLCLKLRIGIHTGRVVVGNIGSSSRQNYTIVGDPVNVAQRLQHMGKEMMDANDEVIVLASSTAVDRAKQAGRFVPVGSRIVRGREEPIGVFVMEADDAGEAGNVVPFVTGTGSGPA